MRYLSDRFKDALGGPHKRATEIICTLPGSTSFLIGQANRQGDGRYGPGWSAAAVSTSLSSGVRYSANLSITPDPGFDTYGAVSTPGAIFKIRHGIDFGAGDVELVDCGVYEAASGGVRITGGDVSLALVDLWQRIERCRFVAPYAPSTGTRASRIASAVTSAMPSAVIEVLDEGGTFTAGANVWDRDRTQFISDMAGDGSLDAAFDASGVFRIRREPVISRATPVWTYKTGPAANVITADRERPFDRLYNTVVVVPIDETQTWTRQVVELPDVTHPRHASKIGVVPFFYASPTLTTAAAARAAGVTIMQRVLGTTETVSVEAFSNPAQEAGDVVTLLHEATETDPGFQALHLVESQTMDLATGSATLSTRSSALADVEEAA